MADVKWIKLSTNIFSDNRKIKSIEIMPKGDTLIVIWIKLLILAGKINDGGAIYITPEVPYSLRALASEVKRPIKTVKNALETFKNYEMITVVGDFIHISSWSDYQNIDGLEALREKDRLRKQKERENQRTVQGQSKDSHGICPKERKEEKRSKKEEYKEIQDLDIECESKTLSTDTPTLEEVSEYCRSKGYNFADKFHSYYKSVNWLDKNGRPIDWRAKADYWALIDKEKKPSRYGDFDPEEAFQILALISIQKQSEMIKNIKH